MKRAVRIVAGVVVVACMSAIAFVSYVQLTWRRDFSSVPMPDVKASTDPDVIARGEYIAQHVAHCSHCHSPAAPRIGDLSGGPAIEAGPFGTYYPPNLTPDDETGIGKRTDGELARAIRSAVSHDGLLAPMMLVGGANMADEDLVAVVSYLRSLPAKKNATPPDQWGFVAKMLSGRFSPRTTPPPAYVAPGGVSAARGAYLAHGPALCVTCHTARDPMQGFALSGPVLAGDPNPHDDKSDAAFVIVAPNLTPDPSTGIMTSWSEDQFVARFRAGRAHPGSIMPWESFQQLTDEDLKSLYAYLRSLPPVAHDVGPVRRARG